MYKEEHIERTSELFGREIAMQYAWVHVWLDDMVRLGVSLLKHRQYRHHEKALNEQFIPFVQQSHPQADLELALKIARQHIIDDMFFVPKSEADFIT